MSTTASNLADGAFANGASGQPNASAVSAVRRDPYESAWGVVLARTARGDEQLQRLAFALSSGQRALLKALDGKSSLLLLVAADPNLRSHRLARDAARLLTFGLVKQIQGELPAELIVQSMNLTMRLPAGVFSPPAPTATPPSPTSSASSTLATAARPAVSVQSSTATTKSAEGPELQLDNLFRPAHSSKHLLVISVVLALFIAAAILLFPWHLP